MFFCVVLCGVQLMCGCCVCCVLVVQLLFFFSSNRTNKQCSWGRVARVCGGIFVPVLSVRVRPRRSPARGGPAGQRVASGECAELGIGSFTYRSLDCHSTEDVRGRWSLLDPCSLRVFQGSASLPCARCSLFSEARQRSRAWQGAIAPFRGAAAA